MVTDPSPRWRGFWFLGVGRYERPGTRIPTNLENPVKKLAGPAALSRPSIRTRIPIAYSDLDYFQEVPVTLRQRLIDGETVEPDERVAKTSITSMVAQLRKEGFEIQTLGNYRYRLAQNGNGHASTSGERPPPPPMPGEHLVLDLTVTGLRLDEDDESLLVTASDGTHEFEFPW